MSTRELLIHWPLPRAGTWAARFTAKAWHRRRGTVLQVPNSQQQQQDAPSQLVERKGTVRPRRSTHNSPIEGGTGCLAQWPRFWPDGIVHPNWQRENNAERQQLRWPAARQPGPNLTRLGIWDLQDRPAGCSLLRLISKLLLEPEPVTELLPPPCYRVADWNFFLNILIVKYIYIKVYIIILLYSIHINIIIYVVKTKYVWPFKSDKENNGYSEREYSIGAGTVINGLKVI